MSLSLDIISIGKVKQDFVLLGEELFLKRLKGKWKVSLKELDSSKYSHLPDKELIKKEAELLLTNVPKQCFLVVLDDKGQSYSSHQMADFIKKRMNAGDSRIVFAIGGAYGHDESVKKKANIILSLSSLTFTYQMTRLILVEQLYRSYTILHGMPYQK